MTRLLSAEQLELLRGYLRKLQSKATSVSAPPLAKLTIEELEILLEAHEENTRLRKEVRAYERIRRASSRDNRALLDPIRNEPEIAAVQQQIERGIHVNNPLATAVGSLITRLKAERHA